MSLFPFSLAMWGSLTGKSQLSRSCPLCLHVRSTRQHPSRSLQLESLEPLKSQNTNHIAL